MSLLALALLSVSPSLPAQDAPGGEDPVGLIGAPELPSPQDVMMLRLRSGDIHWGSIADHDPDGLRFALLSHGGTVELPWSLLDPAQSRKLRERFGYVDVSTDELMVDVETLVLVDGREVSGVILSREGDHFVLKRDGNLQMVPKSRVRNTLRGGRVPALDVYSREELYTMHAAELDVDDPEDHLELAEVCEQILDFEHAAEHYREALELDPDAGQGAVEASLARAERKAEQQAQIEYLREVDILRRRGRFDEAIAMCEDFSRAFPESPLHVEAEEARQKVLLARDDAIREEVRKLWFDHTRRVARRAAKDLDYEAAIAFADEGYHERVLEEVTEDVQEQISPKIQADDVLAYWATRKKVRYQPATYGEGTWLLGEDRALAGTEDESEEEVAGNERDAQRKGLEEKVAKFLDAQRRSRQRRTRAEQVDEHQTFWAGLSVDDKAQWIRAYYVEFGGDFELRDRPRLPNCPTCGGKGVREVIDSGVGGTGRGGGGRGGRGASQGGGGGVHLLACPTCRGIGRQRRVYYR